MTTIETDRLRMMLEALRAHALDREACASVALDNDSEVRTVSIVPDAQCVGCGGEMATAGGDRWCIGTCAGQGVEVTA